VILSRAEEFSAEEIMEPPNLIPSQDVESLVELAQAAQQQGDRRAALTAFEAAAAAHPARVGLKAEGGDRAAGAWAPRRGGGLAAAGASTRAEAHSFAGQARENKQRARLRKHRRGDLGSRSAPCRPQDGWPASKTGSAETLWDFMVAAAPRFLGLPIRASAAEVGPAVVFAQL
jgi:hypothetical protein